MGSPIGSLMADVIMNHVIDETMKLTPILHRPTFFCRYVDDCFATFPDPSSIDIFLNYLNQIHKQIQFTKELETQTPWPSWMCSSKGLKLVSKPAPITSPHTQAFIPNFLVFPLSVTNEILLITSCNALSTFVTLILKWTKIFAQSKTTS